MTLKGAPPRFLQALIGDMTEISSVLELGNKTGPKNGPPYRDWYIDQGCTYVSVDWNGKDGALPLDLREDITAELDGPFDLITNFGTTEHVSEQEPCWRNIHNLLKVGGKLVSHTPCPPHHDNHGIWQPDPEWFKEFAELNHYNIELLEVLEKTMGGSWYLVHVRLRKTKDVPFRFPSTEIHNTRNKD